MRGMWICVGLWGVGVGVIGAPSSSAADYKFAPQTGIVVGATSPLTPAPFTRVWTQQAGELAIARLQERYENAIVNIPMMLKAMREQTNPVVAYTSVVWGDQLLRIVCYMDESRSSILRRSFEIVLEVADGSVSSVPVGTILAESVFRVLLENGQPVMTADVYFTPGIFPDVLPTTLSIADQVVASSWLTFRPGTLVAEHTFTSIAPPDGSPAIVYHDRQLIPIEPRR
jgi:hypothetical protein